MWLDDCKVLIASLTEYLYTGTGDGKIVVIHKGSMRVLARLGKEPCGKCSLFHHCIIVNISYLGHNLCAVLGKFFLIDFYEIMDCSICFKQF